MPDNHPEGAVAEYGGATYVKRGGQWVRQGAQQAAPQAAVVGYPTPPNPRAEDRADTKLAIDQTQLALQVEASRRAAAEAEAKRQADAAKADAAAKAAETRREKMERLYSTAGEAEAAIRGADVRLGWGTEGEGFPNTFGIGPWVNPATGALGQATQGIGGTPAFDLDQTFDTMRSIIATGEVMQMRADSPTGAGLGGPTSDRDMILLGASVAPLKPGQRRDKLLREVGKVRDYAGSRAGIPSRAERAAPAMAALRQAQAEEGRVLSVPEMVARARAAQRPASPRPGPPARPAAPAPTRRRRFNPATGKLE